MYRFHNLWISKNRSDKLSWTVRLITCTETAWEHKYLRLFYRCLKCIYWLYYLAFCHVFKYDCLYICTCKFKCFCCVIFTVCTREYRYKYLRSCNLVLCRVNSFCIEKFVLKFNLFNIWACREYTLKFACPVLKCFFHWNYCITIYKFGIVCYKSNLLVLCHNLIKVICWHFSYDRTIFFSE